MTKKTRNDEELRIEEDVETAEEEKQTDESSNLLAEAEAKRDEYLDALLRERASFENYKRRNETAVSKAMIDAKNTAAANFFPIIDNLERALASVQEDSPLKEGVEMIYRQFTTVFESMGITEIEAEGKAFDPNFHNAVMQVDAEDGEESGIVRTVLQKGYCTKDQVLRHSMVVVVK